MYSQYVYTLLQIEMSSVIVNDSKKKLLSFKLSCFFLYHWGDFGQLNEGIYLPEASLTSFENERKDDDDFPSCCRPFYTLAQSYASAIQSVIIFLITVSQSFNGITSISDFASICMKSWLIERLTGIIISCSEKICVPIWLPFLMLHL